jgi:hypothetical protein
MKRLRERNDLPHCAGSKSYARFNHEEVIKYICLCFVIFVGNCFSFSFSLNYFYRYLFVIYVNCMTTDMYIWHAPHSRRVVREDPHKEGRHFRERPYTGLMCMLLI